MVNEIEKYILSCLMNNSKFISRLGGFKADFFETEISRLIFTSIVSQECESLSQIQKKVGLGVSLESLADIYSACVVPNELVFDVYLMKIVEEWKERQKSLLIEEHGYTPEVVQKLIEIDETSIQSKEEIDACEELLQKVEMKYTGQKSPTMIPTGFKSIDDMIEGFDKGELIFIAGASGSGKTTLAVNIAYNVAKEKKRVLFFSLEMREVELYERLVKNVADVNNFTTMSKEKFDKVVKIARAMRERLPLDINDKNIAFESMITEMKLKKPNMVIIDHLNILTSSNNFKDNLMRLEYLTRRMKEVAKELEIPIICVCQLNRSNADRDTKRPNLSDLRGSGSIEQDANMVIGVYRPEYYLLQNKPDDSSKNFDKWEEQMAKYKGKAEILVMKNRRGKTGDCQFLFEGSYYRFTELNNDREGI